MKKTSCKIFKKFKFFPIPIFNGKKIIYTDLKFKRQFLIFFEDEFQIFFIISL